MDAEWLGEAKPFKDLKPKMNVKIYRELGPNSKAIGLTIKFRPPNLTEMVN